MCESTPPKSCSMAPTKSYHAARAEEQDASKDTLAGNAEERAETQNAINDMLPENAEEQDAIKGCRTEGVECSLAEARI